MTAGVFLYSETFVRSLRRKLLWRVALPLLFLTLALFVTLTARAWMWSAVWFTALVVVALRSRQALAAGSMETAHVRQSSVELREGALRFVSPDGVAEVPMDALRFVRMARRQGSTRAIALELSSGETVVLSGLDRMEEFATRLSHMVGAERVGQFRWWQAHPA
jgi:hypothetical protein